MKRKRKNTASVAGGKRKSGLEYLLESTSGEQILGGKWTEEENFLLMQILTDSPELIAGGSESTSVATEEFNKIAVQAKETFGIDNVETKSEKSIESKVAQLKKKKELVYLVLEEQLNIFMKQFQV